MIPYRAALILLVAVLASALLGPAGTVPTAQAAPLDQWRGDGGSRSDWGRDGRDRGRGDRDRDRNDRRDSYRRDRGGREGWHRFHHDDYGDCFRTPWGLACETDVPGMFRVHDRHPGDEWGPDCDLLFIEGPVWTCYDSPYR
jgi:hypothetical protein